MSYNNLVRATNLSNTKNMKTILLILASISFIIIIGGATYEHVAVVPIWKIAPPASLTMFQGEYGLYPGNFWMSIHPITLVLLIAALIANWKTAGRKYIVIPLAGYVAILIITAIYFVPELMSITGTPYQPVADSGLVARAALWEKLSLIRGVLLIGAAATLLFSLTKTNEKRAQRTKIVFE
jgi:hypothetical protein